MENGKFGKKFTFDFNKLKGGFDMEKKVLGILALALVGVFAVSVVAAMPFMSSDDRDSIREAIDAGDYSTWKSLMTSQITEENFEKMTQMHELREQLREAQESGDDEAVDSILAELEDLGVGSMGMGHGMRGSGMGQGIRMGQHEDSCPFAE